MNGQQFVEYHKDIVTRMNEIVKAKNHDYSNGGKGDAFLNFRSVSNIGICSVEQGFLTRMMDKIMRINSFIKQGTLKVSDEKIEDTLMDLANYSILMMAYLKSEKERQINTPDPRIGAVEFEDVFRCELKGMKVKGE